MTQISCLPFESIKPIKFIGINQTHPFCSIVSESKLLYMSGTHVILQNTKTHEQKIVWNNIYTGYIHIIEHQITQYNDHLLAIAIRDTQTLCNFIVILPLNNIQNFKHNSYMHQLKHIEYNQTIKQLRFYQKGSLFAMISQYQKISTLSLCRTSTGDLIYRQSSCNSKFKLSNIWMNKLNCLSLLQQSKKGSARLSLIMVQETTRKFNYNVALQREQQILEYHYQPFQQENIMIVLSNTGFVIFYKINQYELIEFTRIDVRIPLKMLNSLSNNQQRSTLSQSSYNQYSLPTLMQAASHKLILGYSEPVQLSILSFSSFNPKNTKFTVISSALDNYGHIKGVRNMKVCKDNCNIVVTFIIDPLLDKQLNKINEYDENQVFQNLQQTPQKFIYHNNISQQVFTDSVPINQQDNSNQYIVLQIDILSNMIDHEQQALSVQQTFTIHGGHSIVQSVYYCPYNNTIFMLMNNKTLLYYNLSPRQLSSQIGYNMLGYQDFSINGLLMWKNLLQYKPINMAVHPFNFSLLLIYEEIIKFHNYNSQNLFPAFLVTSIKDCKVATYSPLGDIIALATNGVILIVNSYTYQLIKTVALPNIIGSTLPRRVSKTELNKPAASCLSKAINKLLFVNNDDLLVFSGSNTLSLILNQEKAIHFGFVDHKFREKHQKIVYDSLNHLTLITHQEYVLVLGKANLNTNNRCEVICKIPVAATSLHICDSLELLFIGAKDGTVYIIKWPIYHPNDIYTDKSISYRLFDEPIIHLSTSANMNYLFAVSEGASFCISHLVVNRSDQSLDKKIKSALIRLNSVPLRMNDWWLLSSSEQDKKQRQIIKLRGQQSDIVNRHNTDYRQDELSKQQLFNVKKADLQIQYLQELKQYEEEYGLQKILHQISILRDQIKLTRCKRQRLKQEVGGMNQQSLREIFATKKQLQQQFLKCKIFMTKQKNQLIDSQKKQLCSMEASMRIAQQKIIQTGQMGLSRWKQKSADDQITDINIKDDYKQNKEAIQKEFKEDLSNFLDINQTILSKNRHIKINIENINDKMNDLNLQRERLQLDLYKIEEENNNLNQAKEQLLKQNQNNKKMYDKLIKDSKEMQQQLIMQRKIKHNYEINILEMEEQINHLKITENILENKYNELNNNFVLQKQFYAQKQATILHLTNKILQLKAKKKQKNDCNIISKNHYKQILKSIMRNLQVNQVKAIDEIRQQYSVYCEQDKGDQILLSNQFQIMKKGHEKLARDAIKWTEVKQTYMTGLIKNYSKLNSQKLKLTYQYNDLIKVSQEYKMYISYLQREIYKCKKDLQERNSLYRSAQTLKPVEISKKGSGSFINTYDSLKTRQEGNKLQILKHIKKKGVCISLHSTQNDKFITEV